MNFVVPRSTLMTTPRPLCGCALGANDSACHLYPHFGQPDLKQPQLSSLFFEGRMVHPAYTTQPLRQEHAPLRKRANQVPRQYPRQLVRGRFFL